MERVPWPPAPLLALLLALLFLTGAGAGCAPAGDAGGNTGLEGLSLPRAGGDLLLTRVRSQLPTRFVDRRPRLRDKVVLVRFWTDRSEPCRESLPALEALRQEFAEDGLITIAVYHPKPARQANEPAVERLAHELGYFGPIALDPFWRSLRAIWLDTGTREHTTASFVLDRAGRVRFVHPGPEFDALPGTEHAGCRADLEALRQAVEAVLAEE